MTHRATRDLAALLLPLYRPSSTAEAVLPLSTNTLRRVTGPLSEAFSRYTCAVPAESALTLLPTVFEPSCAATALLGANSAPARRRNGSQLLRRGIHLLTTSVAKARLRSPAGAES